MDLELRRHDRSDGVCFVVAGELDIRTAPDLRTAVMRGAAERPGVIELDLSGVSFMDSSGLGTLVSIKRDVEEAQGTLVLSAVPNKVMRILQLTRMDTLFMPSLDASDAG
ncbi:MAG: STAS domain-containing protein [Marmoricola sp.]